MLVLLFICLLGGAFFIHLFQKVIFRKEEPSLNDLWIKLENQDWFKQLLENPNTKKWIIDNKKKGLLVDPYYVQKIIENDMHRETFIKYITEKTQ
ncbi:hypothetical protein [Halalkalibacter urbisdiaboli]|uniref:hypothetical protein n=1 Tax=Halalkalibacter urbisdiaboli TaxID=1960589 RepID=UPI000B43933D|nr:hypothetical protein [Halalkalibacter urbisdiaboli]